jgi:hypothetical protein
MTTACCFGIEQFFRPIPVRRNFEHLARVPATCTFEEGDSNWGTATVHMYSRRYEFVRDCLTGDVYNTDSKLLIRMKCVMLSAGTLLITLMRVISNVAFAIVHPSQIDEAAAEAKRCFQYGVSCCGAALYGIIDPYEGRKLYSQLERSLHHDENYADRRNNCYLAQCFIPINFNVANKFDKAQTLLMLKRKIYLDGIA